MRGNRDETSGSDGTGTCKWFPFCPMKRFLERGVLEPAWVERFCRKNWGSCVRYQMEERGEPHPDWMLPDGSLDERLRT